MKDGGSTALCVINVGKELFVINVGDSACVLIDKDFQITKLNQEHKPDRVDESKRIIDNNGFVLTIKYQNNQKEIRLELMVNWQQVDLLVIQNILNMDQLLFLKSLNCN
ncbi:unnamed protein product [Paramecium primaurelia]|uniref:PPM-type phosphatase domain-containing protein n=1 Tax=Paramecium primaurelia TaxID=5886 RepID=A0A8S1NC20_PARPR|nr:unnamed protein product [Paramecium primaurelia]